MAKLLNANDYMDIFNIVIDLSAVLNFGWFMKLLNYMLIKIKQIKRT